MSDKAVKKVPTEVVDVDIFAQGLDPKWQGLIRQIISFIGGVLLVTGVDLDLAGFADELIAVIGGVVGLIAAIKSWFAPEKEIARIANTHIAMNVPVVEEEVTEEVIVVKKSK